MSVILSPIGHHAFRTGNNYGFIGTIDEVRLCRRALTVGEVDSTSYRIEGRR